MKWLLVLAGSIFILSCSTTRNIIVKRDVALPADVEIKKFDPTLSQDSLLYHYQLIQELIRKPEDIKYRFNDTSRKNIEWLFVAFERFVKDSIKTGYSIIDDEILGVFGRIEIVHDIRIKSLDNNSKLWFCFSKKCGKPWIFYWVTKKDNPDYPYSFEPVDE